MRKMISFSKVLCSFLIMLLFIAYLSGCCGVESTTDSETIKTGSIDVSSITENTDSVLPTPSPSTAPETYVSIPANQDRVSRASKTPQSGVIKTVKSGRMGTA